MIPKREKSYGESRHIGACALTERRTSPKQARAFSLAEQRCAEIERLMRRRFPAGVPATDDLSVWASPLADHLASAARLTGREPRPDEIVERLRHLCPGAPEREIAEIAITACRTIRRWSAERLGIALNVTRAERVDLGFRAMRPADAATNAAFRAMKREQERARGTRRRQQAGAAPRARPAETNAEIAARLGVSVRHVQRLRKSGRLECHGSVQTKENETLTADFGVTSGTAEGVAGPRASARPDPDAGILKIVERVEAVAASVRRLADRVDQALLPVHRVVRRVLRGG